MVNAVKHFAVYLLGKQFSIITDHGALKYLQTMKNGGARLMRWAMALQLFSYVVHRLGAEHNNASGLSRSLDIHKTVKLKMRAPISLQKKATATNTDEHSVYGIILYSKV